jgi:hypothetical protein
MMGRQDELAQLFYKLSLDRYIPADHLLRQFDAMLDLSMIRRTSAPYYAVGGRPSIDLELMIRVLKTSRNCFCARKGQGNRFCICLHA